MKKICNLVMMSLCCFVASQVTFADAPQVDDMVVKEAKSHTQFGEPDAGWFCDHWPQSCIEVCESGSSPWGPYEVCRLRPPWDPIPSSNNPYDLVGQFHNDALEKIGAMGKFADLDKRLVTTHMIQQTAEFVCENDVPDVIATERTLVGDDCVYRNAGIATEVFDALKEAIYLDVPTEKLVDAYQEAFKNTGSLSEQQLAAIHDLYMLFPSDDNIDDLPYVFEKIDAFDDYVQRQMSSREAEAVLLGSSVMRASLDYWLNELDGPSDWLSFEFDDVEPTAARRGILKKILTLVAADAGGCLGGAAIAGPLGCVAGGIAGSAGAGAAML